MPAILGHHPLVLRIHVAYTNLVLLGDVRGKLLVKIKQVGRPVEYIYVQHLLPLSQHGYCISGEISTPPAFDEENVCQFETCSEDESLKLTVRASSSREEVIRYISAQFRLYLNHFLFNFPQNLLIIYGILCYKTAR